WLTCAAARCQLNRSLLLPALPAINFERVIHFAVARTCNRLEALSLGCELSGETDACVGVFGPLRLAVEVLRRFKIAILFGNESAVVQCEGTVRIERVRLQEILSRSVPVVLVCFENSADSQHDGLRSGGACVAHTLFQSLRAGSRHVADGLSTPCPVGRHDSRFSRVRRRGSEVITKGTIEIADRFACHSEV